MKKFLSIILACLFAQLAWAQSGEGYDPENPGDPQVYYRLKVEASPKKGGSVSPSSILQLSANATTFCHASANAGYKFKQWMVGDEVVSTESDFSYTMPEENITLIAYFDWVGNEGYNPENPGDPFAEGYQHKVTLYATPSVGGSFNSSSFYLSEGETTNVYAYPNSGYRFVSWKQNGKIVSAKNPMEITMGTENQEYTAQFVYDPVNPANPGSNHFNAATGELVIDDFKPGRLSSAIYATLGTDDNYDKVKGIIIIGTMRADDFGFLRGMSNCSVVDISRTTGYSNVPDYAFEGAVALKTLTLPYSVESIGDRAFCDCNSLTTLYCYATTPPSVSSATFNGVPSSMKVLVPALSLELYQSANYWKDFVLSALDGATNTLTISLPEDAKDGRYKNMTLELDNITSGQVSRMLITDRTRYSFVNLIHNTKYNVYVKTAKSVVLGEIQDVEIVDKDVETAFTQLKQPQTVTMSVINDKGDNLTKSTDITWFDANGNYLATGNTIAGYVDGTVLKYRIKLSNEAALSYVAPQDSIYEIKASVNEFNCVLTPLQLITLTGYVKNANTKKGIYDASVSISQQTSGKQNRTVVVKTDANGRFTAEVYNSSASISCTAFDYVNKSVEVESFEVADGKAAMEDVMMNSIVGATVNISLTYQESVLEGETPDVKDWYNDYQNLALSVFNLTTGQEVTQISNRYPQFVLMDGVKVGDELRLTLSSKKSAFTPVVIDKKVDESEEMDVSFAIKQYGGMRASYQATTNDAVVGILYDKIGCLQQKNEFANDNTLSINGLKDGDYTLVVMGKNDSYNSIYNIARLRDAGLTENTDYSKSNVTVESGIIRNINITNVPFLNIVKFHTINNEKSSLSVNKSSIVAGNYLTFTGVVELQDESITITDNMSLVVDIPASASFVKGSVMVGDKVVDNYTFSDNTLTVPFNNVGQQNKIKFCVIPTIEGTYQPNAMVGFKANGEDVMIPIGSTKYDVDQMSISVPSVTTRKELVLSGIAPVNAEIRVYDGNVLMTSFTTSATGEWKVSTELSNPLNLTLHSIYATATNGEVIVESPVYSCFYNKDDNAVKSVAMSHFNNYYKENKTVVFDFKNKTTTPSSYMFYQTADFSFVVDFDNNSPEILSNVELIIKTKNGFRTHVDAIYDSSIDKWIANHSFSSNNLPTNVSVSYVSTAINEYNTDEQMSLEIEKMDFWRDFIDESTQNEISFEIESDEENSLSCYYYYYNEGEAPLHMIANILDFNETCNRLQKKQFDYIKTDSGYYFRDISYANEAVCVTIVDTEEEFAFKLNLGKRNTKSRTVSNAKGNVSRAAVKFLKNRWKSGEFLGDLEDVVSGVLDALDIGKYLDAPNFETWCDILDSNMETLNKMSTAVTTALTAKCEDGQLRLSSEQISKYNDLRNSYDNLASQYMDVYYSYLDLYQHKLGNSLYYDLITTGFTEVLGSLASAGIFMKNSKNAKYFKYILPARNSNQRNWLTNAIGIAFNTTVNGITNIIDPIANPEFADFTSTVQELDAWAPQQYNNLLNLYSTLISEIKANYKKCKARCPKCNKLLDECVCEENDETDDVMPIIDPSGYVYEGVFNNRIEGVTTTCYQKIQVEDMYGDLHDNIVKWDAEEYGQENPLHTDKNGFYQWFVPEGLWQVKYEKEGYETAYSEWLPVPPPQLDVNIGIVQNRQPEVKEARAYEDGIEFTFDKYMMPTYLTSENIKVSQNGKYVNGKVVLVDEEMAYRDENVKYASTVRFVPDTTFSADKEVLLVVANRVKSYAGIQMADNFTQSFDIEKEVKGIVADSLVKVPYQGCQVVMLYVLPTDAAVGKKIHGESSSDMIASLVQNDVVIDENGMAQFEIKGELPGTTGITFGIDGVKASATVIATVGNFDVLLVDEPTANIASGTTVEKGTKIVLTCATEGATIYYTLDGSCPCDVATRLVYSEPIIINETVTIKAMAVAPDMTESDIVEFTYIVGEGDGIDGVTINENLQIYPLPVRDRLNVAAGGKIIKSVTLTSMNGSTVVTVVKPAKYVSLDVSTVASGIYIVSVITEEKTYSRKIMKVE